MHSVIVFYACALTLLLQPVTSDPVLPIIPLDEMNADSACLFMCMICFPEKLHETEMMSCANTVCSPNSCNAPGLVWLGRACKNPKLLDTFLPSDSTPPPPHHAPPPISQQASV